MNIFDEEDKLLFLIDDTDLKAKAIKNSILPRLVEMVEEMISKIIDIYKVDFYSDNSVIKSPNFRTGTRNGKIKIDYDYCSAGFSGLRKANKWIAIKKKSGKIAEILPIQFQAYLDRTGFRLVLHNQYLSSFNKDTYNLFFDFIVKYNDLIQALLLIGGFSPVTWFDKNNKYIETYKNKLLYSQSQNWNEIIYETHTIKFPFEVADKEHILNAVITLYPLYYSFINLSKGESDMFQQNIEILNKYKWENREGQFVTPKKPITYDEPLKSKVAKLIDNKVKIIPSIRWQVFQRDNWRCLSCGRTADDGIILHVDHIIPRSKGGEDALHNFQTLCNLCNIGKSNKDRTNLREK